MAQLKAESYVPSSYTLTLMGSFGTKKKWGCRQVKKITLTDAKIPDFAKKNKITYDKQNLLEQIRLQRKKSNLMKASHFQLLRTISRSRLRVDKAVKGEVREQSQNKFRNLKREIEQLFEAVEQQSKQIAEIKSSKKYNRYAQLLVMRDTYLQQISEVKAKMKSYKYQLRQRENAKLQKRLRSRNIELMNKAVEGKIEKENMKLVEEIHSVSVEIHQNKAKRNDYMKERARLLKDIMELQEKTGSIYVFKESEQIQEPFSGGKSLGVVNAIQEEKEQTAEYQQSYESSYQQQSSGDSEEKEQFHSVKRNLSF